MDKLSFRLETFEGPMDLMLHLISRNKLNIYDINICELVRQYMDYIALMQENLMEVSSEFVEMASRLVYIKSVSLLPRREDEADELRDALSGELLEYQTMKKLAAGLSAMTGGFGKFVREPTLPDPDETYLLTHDREVLPDWFLAAVGRGMRRLPPSKEDFAPIVKKPFIPVSAKIVFLLRKLWNGQKIRYRKIFEQVRSRSEAIATFLAVLELIHDHRVVMDSGDNLQLVRNKEKESNANESI